MKVVHSKTPTEEVKFTNVFGDEYVPEEHELDFLFTDDCQNQIVGLAQDIIDHEDILHMLGEKVQAVEDAQFDDAENLSKVIDVIDGLQKASKMMLDVIIAQDDEIKNLEAEQKVLGNAWFRWLMITIIWLIVLTGGVGYYVFF